MRLFTLLLSITLLAIKVLADEDHEEHLAPIVENNPKSATFQAVLQTGRPVQGQITGVSHDNGTGVDFNINFFDFPPSEDGPFKYHIHVNPIPEDGNCSGAGGHLSPYGRQDTPECDAEDPTTCQPGDLSGKHGAIDSTSEEKNFQRTYLDLYLSTNPESVSFFGNRSVVVHALNGTRLNCANFTQQGQANNGSGGYGGGNGPEGYNPVNGGGGTSNDTHNSTHNGTGAATNASTGGADSMVKIFKPELTLAVALALGYALFLL